MDASLDNANNPFSTSNGAADIQQQKSTTAEGLLLNLDSFKSTNNGTNEFSPDEFFNNDLVAPTASNTNGKKMSSPFDGDDFGPETDVDAVDEAVLSPSSLTTAKAMAEGICNNNPEMEGGFNPFMDHEDQLKKEDKMDLEIEQAFGNDNVMDFKPSSPREETPTPPADTVHDGGLIENPGDSESEDEWNYFKGDDANKETRNLSQSEKEIAETSEDDNMSNLNPNAAEFVPVSPTRSAPSPICKALLNDEVIAQSPKRPTQNELDINVPSPVDFEKEVKSRPSEVDMFTTNGHSDNEHNDSISSQENRENQDPQAMMADSPLNGKTIDEIPEFQPSPIKSVDEFHFGPNAAPFSPARTLDQSEAGLSTRAVCGDESTILNTSFNESDMKDSMSMSIYQDKDEGNPFDKPDLNQVQLLPDNLDEFLQKSNDSDGNLIVNDSMSDTISDLPEHNPLEESGKEKAVVDDEEKELASPLNETSELDSDLVKNISDITPEQEEKLLAEDSSVQQDLLGDSNDFLCTIPKSPIEDLHVNNSLIEINNTEIKEPEQAEKTEKQEVEVASPINNIDNTLIPEVCPISSPVSVATTDVNSFLDRSELPDVASPLSPNEQKMDEALSQLADQAIPDVLSKCVFPLPPENHQFDVRTENITPEFAQEAILSPGEHSDASEVPTAPLVEEEPVPEVNKTEAIEVKPEDLKEITDLKDFKEVSDLKEVKSEVKEVKEEVSLVEKVAPVAAEVFKTEDKAKKSEQKIEKDVKKSTVEKKSSLGAKPASKPSGAVKTTTSATAARKPISKSAAAAPRAPTAAKTASSITTAASKPTARPTTARPKTAPATARTAATTERKPLTNGVAKTTTTTARSTLTAKKTDSLSKTPTKLAASGATSTTRTTPLKSTTTTKTSTVGATAANKTAASPRAAATRPMTLSRPATARTTTTTAKTSTTTATKTMSSTTTTSRTTTSRPTTARTTTTTTTSTTLSKPRVPATRTITKSSNQPDTEKQLKESANKMTASRTATRTTTSTARKSTETKTLGNRTTAAKSTTSATAKSTTAKKPVEIVRSKTTKTTKIEKPKENGIAAATTATTTTTVVTEQLIAVNDDVIIRNNGAEEEVVKNTNIPNDDLIKDNSPIDNKLILENNTLNETTTAAD